MTSIADLKRKWMRNPEFKRRYEESAPEYEEARRRIEERAPRPPEELVHALQDRIHLDAGECRAANSMKVVVK